MDRNDPSHVRPIFRPRSSARAPLLDPAGMPALANLSHEAGVAYVAGLLAQVSAGDDASVLAGADPDTGRPVWALVSAYSEDPEAVHVGCYDGHPDDGEFADGGGIAEAVLDVAQGDLIEQAAFVYDLIVRETT